VLDLLRSQKLNVTGVSLVASVLDRDNKAELLESIQDKTQSEIDAIAARYRPAIAFRDRVKPVKVVVPDSRTAAREGPATRSTSSASAESNFAHNGQSRALTDCAAGANRSGNGRNLGIEQKLLIQFLTNKEFMKKYEEVRALLSQRLSDTSFENVFEALINEFLDRHSPTRRKARRDKKWSQTTGENPRLTTRGQSRRPAREKSRRAPRTAPTRAEPSPEAQPKPRSRYIPAAVREKVFARDKGCCSYIGKTGRRCGSTQALQVDHIKPFARGGPNSASNLRLLCAKHNRLAAEEVFGEDFAKRSLSRE
jgi:5-methylcytosine-specific restriction endonuclease McrA